MSEAMNFLGYCMSKEGTYGEPVKLTSLEDVSKFLNENVEKHYELRITNSDDSIAMHVVDQTLAFPIPEGGSPDNKWDPVVKKFVTTDINRGVNVKMSPDAMDKFRNAIAFQRCYEEVKRVVPIQDEAKLTEIAELLHEAINNPELEAAHAKKILEGMQANEAVKEEMAQVFVAKLQEFIALATSPCSTKQIGEV